MTTTSSVHAANDYWKQSPETRLEYKQWVAAKQRAQQQVQIPATVSEDEGERSDPVEEDDEQAKNVVEAEEQVEAKPKKEPSRWVQYQMLSRAELIEENPGSKPKLSDVNARARQYYVADGWAK